MIPAVKHVVKASYGAALHDVLMRLPDTDTMARIHEYGLEQHLPPWVDWSTGHVDQQQLDEAILGVLNSLYLTPPEFMSYMEREQQDNLSLPAEPFKALNYRLVQEILRISPQGHVNSLVYKLGTARVNQEVGMANLQRLYEKTTHYAEGDFLRYIQLMTSQNLRTHQRLVDELPALEAVLVSIPLEHIPQTDVIIFHSYPDIERHMLDRTA